MGTKETMRQFGNSLIIPLKANNTIGAPLKNTNHCEPANHFTKKFIGTPLKNTHYCATTHQLTEKFIGVLMPGSDSGKIAFSEAKADGNFNRGLAPASLPTVAIAEVGCAKIAFRHQELFDYFLAIQKVMKK